MLKVSHQGVLDNSRFTYSLNIYYMPCMVLKYFGVKKIQWLNILVHLFTEHLSPRNIPTANSRHHYPLGPTQKRVS
ncbi:hypothetical protein I79_008196 [Cricetulus griseus]|uniref:Uncharacterized protein n=1 Tax=Cricetulus griseus TaxID=10029 RepID=G3HCI5_CRIGR|nr:hypothetical protein I79_008196 [Cricetulus griseus]